MAIAEYTILIGFALAGLIWVLGRHPGTVSVTHGWFSLNGVNGKGDLAAGLVASVYIFSGWDGTFYVNEEVRRRRRVRADRAIPGELVAAELVTLVPAARDQCPGNRPAAAVR